MKKIAVCLPSFNESDNIQSITHLIDVSLSSIDNNYQCVMVNCDNNSPDNTNQIFENTYTKTRKISFVTEEKGKGTNIYNFLQFCKKENIDYGITIDSDTKSFDSSWIYKILNELENGNDFVCSIYKRRKEEGNTTNHFATLVLYSLYGRFIRQPIGGDYGFNFRYINTILTKNFTENIMKYGIDIFMVITALVNDMKLVEVDLGIKIHAVSYQKMSDVFEGVVRGTIETYKQYPFMLDAMSIDYKAYRLVNEEWKYRKELDNLYHNLLIEFNCCSSDYQKIEQEWLNMLCDFLSNILNIEESFIEKFKKMFMLQSISFWDKVNKENDEQWENNIINNCKELRRIYENRNSK